MKLTRALLFILPVTLPAVAAEKPDFRREVLPLLSSKCFHCHGPDEKTREGGLRLDVREEALRERDGVRAIVPGDLKASEAVLRIETQDKDDVMPPAKEGHPLSAQEIDVLKKWIAGGAEYAKHWAFEAPQRQEPPKLQTPNPKPQTPIDAFVQSGLAKAGLALSPQADPHTLLRRLSLDLTGLPATPEEAEAFAREFIQHPASSLQHRVDALLASPHFGEKWARMWLDLARYADSTGYGSDALRLNVWPYRDWVIASFNANKPYDQFTIEQIAGDLLPGATPEQIAATAFHRNTMTNTEGGTPDEEYRVAAVKDRVATSAQVWMGLTLGCAQCHTHKFDPISKKEYYQAFAIFNQTEDNDRPDEAPRMPLPTAHERKQREKIEAEIAAIEAKAKESGAEFEAELHEWEAAAGQAVKWQPLVVTDATTREGKLSPQADGSLLAPAKHAEKEKWTVLATTALREITALRVEVLPAAEGKSVGPAGNAVLSELSIAAKPAAGVPRARFVRLEQDGGTFIQLAEMQAFAAAENVALRGTATQSSTYADAAAKRAIDGKTDGIYANGSVAHTNDNDKSPWWEVDLGGEHALDRIVVWNRAEAGERMAGARLIALDAQRREVFRTAMAKQPQPSAEFRPSEGVVAQFAGASADFAQDGWDAAKAVDGDEKTGWGFAPQTGVAHAGAFELKVPLAGGQGTQLTITLRQDYGQGHNLQRVRISATDAKPPVRELPAAIRATLALEPTERSAAQRGEIAAYFRPLSKAHAVFAKQIDAKRAELAKIKAVELPIMRELPEKNRRKSFSFAKGNYLLPEEEVAPGLPAAFHPAPAGAIDRLAFAKWLVARDNPLTARVAVNRVWAQLFGAGLVESEEDFGTQGSQPSHPELLDWLAIEFMEPSEKGARPWDVKRLIRLIVTSATYQQSSRVNADAAQRDPRNRLLSRYPRRRLGAEEVRDQALQAAGLLSQKIGGPSVYPPQPEGLWKVAFNGDRGYATSTGEDRWRRDLYTIWRRTVPNPTMSTFDAPSRETCTIRRTPTNTPLQAFVTMNDPVFVEASQALARRILREGGATSESRLRFALRLCLARPIDEMQLAPLRALLDEELKNYAAAPDAAKQLITNKELGPLPAGVNEAELAAWTVVANVLLNLDGVLTKG